MIYQNQPPRISGRVTVALAFAFISLGLSSCVTTGGGAAGTGGRLPASALNHPAVKDRNARIALETVGDYYIGRRWWVDGTRFWGYLRKPRQPWSEARLVIMDESGTYQPDRRPEEGVPDPHGFDHNFEYRIWGSFTGRVAYDPNSNFEVPIFRLSRYELVSRNPGFVFYPGETYSPKKLPPKHPPTP